MELIGNKFLILFLKSPFKVTRIRLFSVHVDIICEVKKNILHPNRIGATARNKSQNMVGF